MTSQLALQGQVPPFERRLAIIIVALIVYGVFFPPESYFADQSFAIQASGGEATSFPPIGRFVNFLLLLWLVRLYAMRVKIMIESLLRGWLPLTFGLLAVSSAFWASDFSGSINRSLRMVIIILFALYFERCFNARERISVLTYAMALAVVGSILAVILIPQFGMSTLTGYADAWRGAFSHKNTFGAVMATGVFVGYFAYTLKATSGRLALFVLFTCLILTITSRSATAIVTMFATWPIVLGITWVIESRRIEKKTMIVFFGIVCAVGAMFVLNDREFFELLGRSETFTGRESIWLLTESAIAANPIYGYGHTFWAFPSPMRDEIWRQLNWAPPHAHNTFLDVWLQLGIPGVILFCSMLVIVVLRALRMLFTRMPRSAVLWVVLLLQMIMRGITETVILDPSIQGMFWLTVMYVAFSRPQPTRNELAYAKG